MGGDPRRQEQARHERAVLETLLDICLNLRRLHPAGPQERACRTVAAWLRGRLRETGGSRERK